MRVLFIEVCPKAAPASSHEEGDVFVEYVEVTDGDYSRLGVELITITDDLGFVTNISAADEYAYHKIDDFIEEHDAVVILDKMVLSLLESIGVLIPGGKVIILEDIVTKNSDKYFGVEARLNILHEFVKKYVPKDYAESIVGKPCLRHPAYFSYVNDDTIEMFNSNINIVRAMQTSFMCYSLRNHNLM